MRALNGVFVGLAVTLLIASSAPAHAQVKREAPPVGVKALSTVHPSEGFVEDAYAFDGSGGRLAIVRADASTLAEVQILDLTQAGAVLAKFDVSPATTWVTSIAFVLDGNQVFLTGKTADETRVTGYVYDLAGKQK